MTATEEQPAKSTTEHSPDSQPSAIASSATPEPNDGTTAALTPQGPDPAPASNDFPPPSAVHTSSETANRSTDDGGEHLPLSSDEIPTDPKIVTLLGMFPDFDVSLLQSVLQSVSGDQDRAIDVLLGMSDPEYKPTARPDATQTELDEEIARRLMLEEREQQQRAWQPQAAPPRVPYEQRSHHPTRGSTEQRPAEGEGMAQFQEQLGKFAETGKKTFNTLFSKVKAKIQEFDTPSPQGQPSGSSNPPPRGDSWNTPAQAQPYYNPNPPQPLQGYRVGEPESHPPASINQGRVSEAVHPVGTEGPTTTTPPTNTAAPVANVDPSKIGLLPKRPVSLGSSTQPSTNPNDDEVEYVESPFEEPSRR